ncbi:MAG TPA: hypothetical protein VM432_13700, partial [Bdellovibrionales bacterium]|nr:hypothetical protein [Bdellovibrionales bacterium]
MKTITWLMCAAVLSFTNLSYASTICDAFRTPGQEKKLANCETVVARGLIPNTNALSYTIKYLNENQNGLKDPSCAIDGIDPSDDCHSCRNPDWVKSGFENKCSFIINDLQTPWKRNVAKNRSTAYYVDL